MYLWQMNSTDSHRTPFSVSEALETAYYIVKQKKCFRVIFKANGRLTVQNKKGILTTLKFLTFWTFWESFNKQ